MHKTISGTVGLLTLVLWISPASGQKAQRDAIHVDLEVVDSYGGRVKYAKLRIDSAYNTDKSIHELLEYKRGRFFDLTLWILQVYLRGAR